MMDELGIISNNSKTKGFLESFNNIFNSEIGYTEYSLKITKNEVADNRITITLKPKRIDKSYFYTNSTPLLNFLGKHSFPSSQIDKILYYYSIPDLNGIGFGIDASNIYTVYKVYFEYGDSNNSIYSIKWNTEIYDTEHYILKNIADLPNLVKELNLNILINYNLLYSFYYTYSEISTKKSLYLRFKDTTFIKDIPKDITDMLYANYNNKNLSLIEKYPIKLLNYGINSNQEVYYSIYFNSKRLFSFN